MINYEVSQHLHGGQGQVSWPQVPLLDHGDDIKSPNCSNMWRLARVDGKIFMKKMRENIQKPRDCPEVLGFLISFWRNIQPSPDLNSKYRHFGCHQYYKRLHLVDCVVARSATKLGGLGACPHSREAKINVQYPPLGVILNIWNTTKYPVPFLSIVALKNRLREMANEGGRGSKILEILRT